MTAVADFDVGTRIIRDAMTELLRENDASHNARRAELQAEVDRLQANIKAMKTYVAGQAGYYEDLVSRARLIADYYRGKADVYAEMAYRADIAYGAAEQTKEATVNESE
ncbi:hypothetical protein D3P07_00925 [Paenibacillus sp. 1011MAR3C5]|uniref:hypothetical protein n=1 Tax=Paenibacillus sp. 1011MAR3C5 TaxID=1675787 RepID=UPI000E6BEBA2|nr:hypothetical protein [Paenibacillus sp. 1011MAR3C5]RJE90701.1 hypothetical protein D3P07_00925 [Paenibacillus sp. 1011MAR3C5]